MITFIFFLLVFLCATQDVAVDGASGMISANVGWALTLLSVDNLSYASTAQTIGLNTGYFLSFTVFLAFNSPEFANKYFRSVPMDEGLVSLGGYLKFWGWMYILVTIWLAKYKKEVRTHSMGLILGTNSNRGRWCKSSIPNNMVDHQITT